MYDARYINAAKYIPWDAYCTLLLWIGWKLARFLFTKTSVNKRLKYVMQYFLLRYYEHRTCPPTFPQRETIRAQNNYFVLTDTKKSA